MATPLTWIEAPTRQPRPNRSLDVIPVHEVTNEHFVGFQYLPDPCGFPSPLPQSCYVTYGPAEGTPKTFEDPGNAVITDVFGVYQGIECFLNGGIDEFEALAERMLTRGEHRTVDGRIAGLLGGATPTVPPASTSIVGAIALLEQYLALEIPGQGYLYMSPNALTYAVSENLVIRNLDGTLETYLGTPIIVLTEPSAAGSIYASGPINIWRGPIVSLQAPNVTINMGRALAERLYSLSIECGAWETTFTVPAEEEPPPPVEDPMVITLGSIPSSPIHDGDSTTIIAQTSEEPDGDITLHYSINGGAEQTLVMVQVDTLQFVHAVVGDETGPGDSVELWATGDYDGDASESNHITILVVSP